MKYGRGVAMLEPMSNVSVLLSRRGGFALPAIMLLAVLAGCTPTRSVVVQRTRNGTPVHAQGRMGAHTYTVVRGDTLYSIAFRAGDDYRDVARWNGISAPYIIHPGQRLRLTPPTQAQAHQAAASAPVFHTVSPPPRHPVHAAPRAAHVAAKPAAVAAAASSTAVSVAHDTASAASATEPEKDATTPVRADARTHSQGGIAWQWPVSGALIRSYHATDAIPGLQIAGHAGDPVRAAAAGTVVYSGNGLVGYGELIIIKHSDEYLSAYGHNSKRLVKEGEHVKAGQLIARMGASGASRVELQFQIRRSGKPVDPAGYLPSK